MASSKASLSWSRAAISTSGTKRPPQSPKCPDGSGRWATSAASRLDIEQVSGQVVLVGLEVEVAVAAEVEDDRLGAALLLAAQGLVDHGPDRVRRLRGREDALGPGELHRRLEDLGLRVGHGLDVVLLAQQRHQRRVAVVAQPAGVDRGRDEVGPQGVHGDQRRHASFSASSGKVKPPKLDPPPTQATSTSGSTPAWVSCAFSSSPMTVWWSSTWLSTLPRA